MNQPFTSFQDFKRRYPIRPNDEGSLLGSGSYGRVIKVEDQVETEWVAIKISEFKGNDTKSLKAEVELAQRVPRQTNIARYDACYRLETDTSVSDFAIMKYYPDGNLADLIRRVTLTPTQIYDITQGILLGLQHLHRQRIVHRDFKPANILISRDYAGRFIPKIADFGLSKLVSDDELDSSDFDLSDGRGTPSYKAPEQIEGSRVSFNLDLWAFGVILYELMTGEKPFRANLRNSSDQSVRREIEKKIITVELPARLNQVAEPYASMIRRCLVRDIHQRARKAQELLDLLDQIPQLLAEANRLVGRQQYNDALALFEEVLAKREHHAEARKGVDQCKAALEQQHISTLLNDADALLAQQQVEQAKSRYEQVLHINPAHAAAARGLVFCIDRLRPQPVVIEPDVTDVYREEQTDVYVAPSASAPAGKTSKPLIGRESVAVATPGVQPTPQSEPVAQPIIASPVRQPLGKPFPWRVVAPATVGLVTLALYFTLRDRTQPATTGTVQPRDSSVTVRAEIISGGKKLPDTVTAIVPRLGESKDALTKRRIDVALDKARRAYKVKDFEQVLVLTNSALQLDPTRRDVVALRDAALKESQKKPSGTPEPDKPTPLTTTAPEVPKDVVPAPAESEKSKLSEPTPEEKAKNEKQKHQDTYDELIDEGMKAITNGNNKTKAVATFNKAQALAKDHQLSTAKADGAYNYNMNKANNLFEREEFDGAKAWYEVALSVKDTPEVRRKIKLCQ
ncbi:serine/threonine-protein kinase [Spirosoma areae]